MRKRPLLTAVALPLALVLAPALGAGGAAAEELVAYEVVEGAIPASLTGVPGDPEAGKAAAVHRQKGNCLACHAMPIPDQPFHGEVGPDLSAVGSYLSEGELRLRLVDSKKINPETSMPGFYKVEGLHRVAEKFRGKPILTAQEVEDVVAYLLTLKGN